MTATREGVVNRREEALAEINKARKEEVFNEIKEGGEDPTALEGGKDVPDDPLKPADIPAEDWAAMSDEQKNHAITEEKARSHGETDEQKAAREAEEKAEEERNAAEAAKKYKGKVDGQEVEFEEKAVIEAGLRALQKESAADKRLEEATRAREEAERLRKEVETLATKFQQPGGPEKKPTELLVEKDALRGIVKAIQYGGEEEAAAALQEYGQKMAQLGQANAITAAELQNMLELREAQQFVRKEYADVMSDPNMKQLFVLKVNEKLAAGDARPYQELCKDAGDELRAWKGAPPQKEPTQQLGGNRAAVHQRKTTIVQIPSASARQQAPTQPKAPTPSETIDQMRKARRQA